jgi:hypothetical protein
MLRILLSLILCLLCGVGPARHRKPILNAVLETHREMIERPSRTDDRPGA